MKFNSIRFKTSVLYTSILLIIMLVFSAILFFEVRTLLYRDIDNDLRIKAQEISVILNAYEDIAVRTLNLSSPAVDYLFSEYFLHRAKAVIDEIWRSQSKALNLVNDYIDVLNYQGNSIMLSGNINEELEGLFKGKMMFSLQNEYFKDIKDDKYRFRVINYPFRYRNNVHLIIQVGTPLKNVNNVLLKTLFVIVITIIIILLLTSFMGNYLAHRVLEPVMVVSKQADNISLKDLSQRIIVFQADTEIKQLISSFNSMIIRLDNSFKLMSEFSSNVAHEIKTPLAIMKGELELALAHDRNSREYKRVMESILEEADRMRRIINDLLLLSKYDYDYNIYKYERMEASGFINELVEESRILAMPKKISLTFEHTENSIFINGDAMHLRRLFLNLIINAIKYTAVEGRINIAMKTEGMKVFVAIMDNGEGISEENQAKIFTKFFRVRRESQSYETGTGLGLYIAMTIARAHQGSIEVKSESNQGSTFTVSLPVG